LVIWIGKPACTRRFRKIDTSGNNSLEYLKGRVLSGQKREENIRYQKSEYRFVIWDLKGMSPVKMNKKCDFFTVLLG
jgi:hypothetical protein